MWEFEKTKQKNPKKHSFYIIMQDSKDNQQQ